MTLAEAFLFLWGSVATVVAVFFHNRAETTNIAGMHVTNLLMDVIDGRVVAKRKGGRLLITPADPAQLTNKENSDGERNEA